MQHEEEYRGSLQLGLSLLAIAREIGHRTGNEYQDLDVAASEEMRKVFDKYSKMSDLVFNEIADRSLYETQVIAALRLVQDGMEVIDDDEADV